MHHRADAPTPADETEDTERSAPEHDASPAAWRGPLLATLRILPLALVCFLFAGPCAPWAFTLLSGGLLAVAAPLLAGCTLPRRLRPRALLRPRRRGRGESGD